MGITTGMMSMVGLGAGAILGSGVGQSLLSRVGLGKPSIPTIPAPVIPKPPVMPTLDDQQAMDARRRAIAEQVMRQGRASTILTPQNVNASGKLGG